VDMNSLLYTVTGRMDNNELRVAVWFYGVLPLPTRDAFTRCGWRHVNNELVSDADDYTHEGETRWLSPYVPGRSLLLFGFPHPSTASPRQFSTMRLAVTVPFCWAGLLPSTNSFAPAPLFYPPLHLYLNTPTRTSGRHAHDAFYAYAFSLTVACYISWLPTSPASSMDVQPGSPGWFHSGALRLRTAYKFCHSGLTCGPV